MIVLVIMVVLFTIATIPAVLASLNVAGFGDTVLLIVCPPDGQHVDLLTWLFPYLLFFVLCRVFTVVNRFFVASEEHDHYKICDNDFNICGHYLKVWHVWLVMQAADCISDVATMRSAFSQPHEFALVPVVWGITTLVSLTVPLLYALGRITFPAAMFLELTLEDLEQTFLIWLLCATSGNRMPETLISSCVFAILGVIEGIVQVFRRLRPDDGTNYNQLDPVGRT